MSELKAYKMVNELYCTDRPSVIPAEVYFKSEADKVIAEKDKEIAELKAEIKRKEGVGQRWFERCMEARTENVGLKRSLWIARARCAHNAAMMWEILSDECLTGAQFTIDFKCLGDPDVTEFQMFRGCMDWMEIYENVERKCRAKAEEYK